MAEQKTHLIELSLTISKTKKTDLTKQWGSSSSLMSQLYFEVHRAWSSSLTLIVWLAALGFLWRLLCLFWWAASLNNLLSPCWLSKASHWGSCRSGIFFTSWRFFALLSLASLLVRIDASVATLAASSTLATLAASNKGLSFSSGTSIFWVRTNP